MRPGGVLVLLLGGALGAATLIAEAGISLGPTTLVEIAVTLVGAAIAIYALLFAPTPQRRWGALSLALLSTLAVWSALSISWSVVPSDSWLETNRLVAYVAAFAGAIGLARLFPERGRSVIGAVLLACSLICLIALLEKAFPGATNSTGVLARLREPLGYFNALGAVGAMAVPCALWLGARREGTPLGRAIAYPLLALGLITVLFSYSRGALVALAAGLLVWFVLVPLRLRGVVVLVVSLLPTAGLTAWAFTNDALSKDNQPLPARIDGGGELALWLGVLIVALLGAGLAVSWVAANHPPGPKLRRGFALATVGVALLLPVAGLAALATTERGLPGTITYAWNSFFSAGGSITYGPERLAATGTKRGAYWNEAYDVWQRNWWEGAGAGGYATARLPIRRDAVDVRHAHGYLPQIAADLGTIGLLISLLGTGAWLVAARRSTRPARDDDLAGDRGWPDPRLWAAGAGARLRGLAPRQAGGRLRESLHRAGEPGEGRPLETPRAELVTLVVVVVVFGLHAAIDWTWDFPGVALIALVAAGYVAGHGPVGAPAARRSAPVHARTASALALAVIALAAAYSIWQPLRADAATESSSALLEANRVNDARVLAATAVRRNPVSAEPLYQLAAVEAGRNPARGVTYLRRAVRMQPRNPDTYRALGVYLLGPGNNPSEAYTAFQRALVLDPRSRSLTGSYTEAFQRLPRGNTAPGVVKKATRKPKPGSSASAPTDEVERCRRQITKLEGQLRSGQVKNPEKKRKKLADCKATVSGR